MKDCLCYTYQHANKNKENKLMYVLFVNVYVYY